jgi:hypothetical protein
VVSVPKQLDPQYIGDRWPRLFHLAEAGSWPSIEAHGLLSTTALLDLFEIHGPRRGAIETQRRPDSIRIDHPTYGTALIRDNKPTNATVLRRTLVGMAEDDWYRTLNGRVFFWLTEKRLSRLRQAPAYRARQHDLLTFDTALLLEAHSETVELAHLNTGAVHPSANYPRGAETFRAISAYPWRRRLSVAPSEPIVELTLPYALRDPSRFLVNVETV